jgi:Bacterial protein of unknown function (DUF885)
MQRVVQVMAGLLLVSSTAAGATELTDLGEQFWRWRAKTQPITGDDIPRLARPPGWVPDWSAATVQRQRTALAGFERRWKALRPGTDVATEIDRRLLGSALARVHWELDTLAGWRRNPNFYVAQTVGGLLELLLPPPPFDAARSANIVKQLEAFPRILQDGQKNLDQMRAPFVRLALESLRDGPERIRTLAAALGASLDASSGKELGPAADRAGKALESFRRWLEQRLPGLPEQTAIGRRAYLGFLREIAMVPFTPEQLVAMGRQELDRALSFEALAQNRCQTLPPLPLLPSADALVAREHADEERIRQFLHEQRLLSLPGWVRHYRFRPTPAYLEPLANVGVLDDLTGPGRLDQDGTAYVSAPSPTMGYFEGVAARDPRLQIVHEGVHYLQKVLSAANPDALRRHYYDSGAPEGLAFYNEEMMLQAGLFDDSPRSREILYNMMRLRALRVEVDVKLALGTFTVSEAEQYLVDKVPLDRATARGEAALFSSTPGQAITYQTGKLQILRLIADARLKHGDRFRLETVHDFLWTNGNVPLSLQRWELLGLRDEVDAAAALK